MGWGLWLWNWARNRDEVGACEIARLNLFLLTILQLAAQVQAQSTRTAY